MDFFGQQDRARGMTRKLLVYYALAVLGTILAAYGLTVVVMGALEHEKQKPTWERPQHEFTSGVTAPFADGRWFDPTLFFSITGITALLVACGSGWKTMQFSGGGGSVATLLGGRPVPPGSSDPDKKRLLNVVEEMAIASGLPVPAVYVLDDEEGINAFAAGYSPSDAAIGVTRGTLEKLTRDELQGVVAHEFSHILNGDMRLNMRLTCLTFGILFLAVVGRALLESLRHVRISGGRKGKGGGGIILIILGTGLGLMLIGSIGHFFASLIQAAVSRQREFLADAAAVQFTRNPHGIGHALLKIAGMGKANKMNSAHAMEAGHFFFSDSVVSRWLEWGATHPPLEERIRLIAPELLREDYLDAFVGQAASGGSTAGTSPQAQAVSSFAGSTGPAPAIPDRVAEPGLRAPDLAHLAYAADLLENLPEMVKGAVREPYGARSVVFAMLLSHDPVVSGKQWARLNSLSEPILCQETLRLQEPVRGLDRRVLLPLVDLAQPTLRLLSPAAYREFRQTLNALMEADNEIGLLEYALLKLVKRRLDPQFNQTTGPTPDKLTLAKAWPSVLILLGALAYQNPDPEGSFQAGLAELGAVPGDWTLPEAGLCGLAEADQALEKLATLRRADRPLVMNACTNIVMADGAWSAEEGEWLRAIGDHLDCPIPPFLSSTKNS